ncbi:unnamed protein product, partial [marine sediment metagenome]
DEYALEAAVQLKEKLGGTVTAVTVGPKEWDDVLRRALAMGADRAIRIDEDVVTADSHVVARILEALLRNLPYALILFGAQSEDFGSGQLGVMVAEMLGIPHATLVVSLQVKEGEVRVSRELEGGVLELYSLKLPALLTVQTGINRPRYVSFASIKKAREKELKVMSLGELGLSPETLAPLIMLELGRSIGKQTAHKVTADLAKKALEQGITLKEALLASPIASEHLTPRQIDDLFDPYRQVKVCSKITRDMVAITLKEREED